jgi:hypothetical protein
MHALPDSKPAGARIPLSLSESRAFAVYSGLNVVVTARDADGLEHRERVSVQVKHV